MGSHELKMSFDPNTIEHLGVRMYSTLPPVLAELIANSYDADASQVEVALSDRENKEIIVSDDGLGMSFEDINEKFLRIGRNRRDEYSGITPSGRKVIGKKGLGKLSFFGIAKEIFVTTKKDGRLNSFSMCWEDIKGSATPDYKPKIIDYNKACDINDHGTSITLRDITRASDFIPKDIAVSLSKIFILNEEFSIQVKHNSSAAIAVTNRLKYEDLQKQFEWHVPKDIKAKSSYEHKDDIKGTLVTTLKPISPNTNMRGITLYSRGKLVNVPEYFADNTSSHFFSYLTGWLEVDFIDELDEDVISTDRKSLDWDNPAMASLRNYLREVIRWLETDWRKKRSVKRYEKIQQKTGVKVTDWLEKVPEDVKERLSPLLESVADDAELSDESTAQVIGQIHDLIPEYPRYHWRQLHKEVQLVSKKYYETGDYYTAVFEAVKRYHKLVKDKSSSPLTERDMLENVFQLRYPRLSVTEAFSKSDGSPFNKVTLEDMRMGHRGMALGIWLACRNPIAHEEVLELRESGLFTEHDCLDALSLISHLLRRLDTSTFMPPKESKT